jgi:hypothetical protein
MKAIMPAPADWYPLSCFVVLMFALSVAACALPLWAHALYLAWMITGVAMLVKAGTEPGLPATLWGNVRRLIRAHVWPFYAV